MSDQIHIQKRDKMECANYRGISLLNTACKVLMIVLMEKLKQCAEQSMGVIISVADSPWITYLL